MSAWVIVLVCVVWPAVSIVTALIMGPMMRRRGGRL
jgi:hypothetical protein